MFKQLAAFAVTVFIAGGAMAASDMTQLQLKVKSGLESLGMDVPDDRIIAASNTDLAKVVNILEDSGERPEPPSKKKAKIRVMFGD